MFLQNYFYYFEKALSDDFCDQIIQLGKEQVQQKASTEDVDLQKSRDSSVAWLQDQWLYDKIEPYIQEANVQAGWNFEWQGSETCQFTVYREQQHYCCICL